MPSLRSQCTPLRSTSPPRAAEAGRSSTSARERSSSPPAPPRRALLISLPSPSTPTVSFSPPVRHFTTLKSCSLPFLLSPRPSCFMIYYTVPYYSSTPSFFGLRCCHCSFAHPLAAFASYFLHLLVCVCVCAAITRKTAALSFSFSPSPFFSHTRDFHYRWSNRGYPHIADAFERQRSCAVPLERRAHSISLAFE